MDRRVRRNALSTGIVAAAAVVGLGRTASAQLLNTYFPVFTYGVGGPTPEEVQLLRPDNYSFPGVRAGNFIVRPMVQESFGYDSNVDGVQNGRGSSVLVTDAALSAASDWSRNSLNASITVDDQRYPDRPIEDQTNWTANLAGTYDIGRDQLGASYSHLNLNETPRDLGALVNVQIVSFSLDDLRASYTLNTQGRLSLIPSAELLLYRFSNTPVPGTTVSETSRDRNVYQGGATAQFQLAPQRNVVFVATGTRIEYQQQLLGLPSRNSDGATFLAGLDYQATGVIRYRALVGYQFRSYESSLFGTISAPIGEASVTWTPTRLTTVTAVVRRGIEDAADESIAGYVFTGARIDVDHEYKRDILLNAYTQVENADFHSVAALPPNFAFLQSSGSQTIFNVGASATWIINRNLRAALSYGFTDRRANGTASYTESVGLLSVAVGL